VAESGAARRGDDEAQRRQVTVMFCDLVDSTGLAERLDPEDFRELVRSYHELCSREIAQTGGHLANYLGDGVLAYYGYPVAREQDARAALQAGLAITARMRARNLRSAFPADVRVGIHTGLVVSGDVGYGDRRTDLTVGSTMNIAARLQGEAEPNAVVVSETTYRLTHGFFRFRDLGARGLKGVSRPVRIYEVEEATEAGGRVEAALGTGLSVLVGRDDERARLVGAWEDAAAGRPRIVHVVGEAGTGKSRLLFELRRHLADTPYLDLECRCSPQHESSALYPVVDLLQRVWRLRTVSEPEERLARLERALAPHRASIPDVVPLIASLLGVPAPASAGVADLPSEQRRHRTLETLIALLFAWTAGEQPVLLAVEDLHWLDPSTLELLSRLIERLDSQRLLVVLLYRPRFQPPWAEHAAVRKVAVDRLGESAARTLIRSVAGGHDLPAPIVVALYERSDGVALYLEELTKTVLASGGLEERFGHWELTRPLPDITIPETLQSSLLARIDRLAPIKETLQVAATIGRAFSYELIRAVTGLDDQRMQAELHRLVDAGLLTVSGSAPAVTYVFKHALIQEAAYESLLKPRRRSSHQRIAEVLTARFPEVGAGQPELLGHHWAGAGRIDEALDCYHRAGRRAIERSANVEAARHLARALEQAEQLPAGVEHARREFEVRIDLGVALAATRGYTAPEVEKVYARAYALCTQVDADSQRLYDGLSGLFLFHQARGELSVARELTERRLALAERLNDPALLIQVHENLGTMAYWRGDFANALESLEQALLRYEPARARERALVYGTDTRVVCEAYAAHVLWFLGYPDQARMRSDGAISYAHALGHANSLALALCFGAALRDLCGDAAGTRALADEAVAFASDQHLRFWLGFGAIYQGAAMVAGGDGEQGIAQMLNGVLRHQSVGTKLGAALCLAMLGAAHLAVGRADDGLDILRQGEALLGDYEDRYFDPELLRVRGELMLAAGREDPAAGRAQLEGAVEVARRQGSKGLELRALTSLAHHLASTDRARAVRLLGEACGWFQEGAEMRDVRTARGLLDELSASGPATEAQRP